MLLRRTVFSNVLDLGVEWTLINAIDKCVWNTNRPSCRASLLGEVAQLLLLLLLLLLLETYRVRKKPRTSIRQISQRDGSSRSQDTDS